MELEREKKKELICAFKKKIKTIRSHFFPWRFRNIAYFQNDLLLEPRECFGKFFDRVIKMPGKIVFMKQQHKTEEENTN